MSLFSYEKRPFKFAKAGSEQTEAKFCLLRRRFSHRTAGRFHCHLLARTACHALREPPCTPQAPGPAAAQRNLPHYRYLQHGRLPPVRSTLRPRGRCLRTCLSQLFLCLSAACLGKHSVFGIKGCRKDVSAPSAKSSSHSDAPSGNAQEVVQNAGPTLSSPHIDILYVATGVETQRQSKQALTSTSQSHLPVQDSRNDGCTQKTRNSSVLTSARSSQPVSAASNKEGGGGAHTGTSSGAPRLDAASFAGNSS
jgi:hypothetical protein